MRSPHEQEIMESIRKRAEMLKEVSGIVRPVAVLEPEQSWNEYRTIDRARCRVKCAQTDPGVMARALEQARKLMGIDSHGDAKEKPRWFDVLKTRIMVNRAKSRLRRDDYDIPMVSGRHRVAIPAWGIEEAALPRAGFEPSAIAVPERGQTTMLTYRDPEEQFHLHRHTKNWFLHKDKLPSVTQAAARIKKQPDMHPVEKAKTLAKGVGHLVTEGIPGVYYYLANALTRGPTMEDIVSGKADPELVAARISGGSVKKAELVLEVASTAADRARGLSGRPRIPDDYGMLFTKAGAYWMKGVPFDLDIMFLDKRGCVLDTTTMKALRKGEYPEIYSSKSAEAALAVEVPAGWCARRGIQPGDRITLETSNGKEARR